MATKTRYRVSIPVPHTHLLQVEARWEELAGTGPVELRMAVWTPGSYLVREYSRHVQDVVAEDGDGRRLAVDKTAKNLWRIDRGSARTVVARYAVYANEVSVRTNHVDETHAFWNGAGTYLYLEERRHEAIELMVEPPPRWSVATALDEVMDVTRRPDGGGPHGFRAKNLDELIDSPVECGKHALHEFTTHQRRHRIAVWGRADGTLGYDPQSLVKDVAAIVDVHAELFGGVPYEQYLFILHLAMNAYGGLEHRASSTLLASPTTFSPRKKYEEFLELVSHEYFHLWNVKRIRPEALGPFDYEREAYTRSLWVMEGVTSYYDRLGLRRAGLLPAARYLDKLGEEWGKLLAIPGRAKQSIAESSFDAWIKLYRPDENTVNSTVSYYLKGSLVVLALDLEIRKRTEGARSLDDVMRHLWARYGSADAGFRDDAVRGAFEHASGLDLGASFARLVEGRDEIDLEERLGWFGLRIRADWDGGPADKDASPAWLGAKLVRDGARTLIANVPAESPAERGGLYAGDELLALDGFKVDDRTLQGRLAARRVGDSVRLTVFRREELRALDVQLGARPRDRFEVCAVDSPNEEQRTLYAGWMREPLEVLKKPAPPPG